MLGEVGPALKLSGEALKVSEHLLALRCERKEGLIALKGSLRLIEGALLK